MGKDNSRERLTFLTNECVVTKEHKCHICKQRRFMTLCIYASCRSKESEKRALCYVCLLAHYSWHDLCGEKVVGGQKGDWHQVELDREWAELAMRFYDKQGREASES